MLYLDIYNPCSLHLLSGSSQSTCPQCKEKAEYSKDGMGGIVKDVLCDPSVWEREDCAAKGYRRREERKKQLSEFMMRKGKTE